MSTAKFKNFVTRAYLPECVSKIESIYPEYFKLTITQRDRVIRKIHLISFLMNTIKLVSKTEIQSLELKRKREAESSSSEKSAKKLRGLADEIVSIGNVDREYGEGPSSMYDHAADEPIYEPHSPIWEEGDFEMAEAFEEEAIIQENEEEQSMRFICPILMGLDDTSIIHILTQYGFDIPAGFPITSVDILDKEKAKMIFILEGEMDQYKEHLISRYNMDEEAMGFVIVDYKVGKLELHSCQGLKEESARSFLGIRSKELNAIYGKSEISNEIEADDLVAPYIYLERGKWTGNIEANSTGSIPPKPSYQEMNLPSELPRIAFEEIISNLEDIFETRKGLPQAHWNGKILPYTAIKGFKTTEDKDAAMLKEISSLMGEYKNCIHFIGKETDKDALAETYDLIKKAIETDGFDNFRFIEAKRNFSSTYNRSNWLKENFTEREAKVLMESVGYGKKGAKIGEDEATKQPEYHKIEKKSYPDWMIDLFSRECQERENTVYNEIWFDEMDPDHIIDEVAVTVCKKIHALFSRTYCAASIARYVNVCSRIGGAYLINISKENRAHNSIAIMPIYHIEKEGEESVRILSGFIMRGPHHVRSGTDKINLIRCERIRDDLPLTMLKKGLVLEDDKGNHWFICKDAMMRIYPTYGAFLHDLLFLPTNFLGEIIFKEQIDKETITERAVSIFEENRDFLIQRFVELMFMGMTGGSQEEGFFSGFRMLYMILLELSRGNFASLINLPGFFGSINECIISNCYVLFSYGNLVHTLKYIKDNCIIGGDGFLFK
uniref:Polymerase PA n=1 Tax=Jiujie Fly Virus TaxID=1608055 RepID=A0A1L3KKM6_9ORTO|nr:polymerase PA [Jiujie Fly Virus]